MTTNNREVEPAPEPTPEPYRSLPLPQESGSIRVLDILAPSTSTNIGHETPIEGYLRIVDLDQTTQFSALSYVWGTSVPAATAKTILCGQISLPVTDNCYSALVHLRRKFGKLALWIDAICINQSDDAEKAHQISLMKDIYPAAEQVYVWLGEGDLGVDRAMSYLSSAGLLEYFFVDGAPIAQELPKPQIWAAARKALFVAINYRRQIFPSCKFSLLFVNWECDI